MRDRIKILIGVVCLAAALLAGQYAYRQYNRLVTTAPIVVPAIDLPPYTLVRAQDLTTRPMPRGLLNEPVYSHASDLVGKMTNTRLAAGQLIYRSQVSDPSQFRLAADPSLEVVSFPVRVEQAVGGQVWPGSVINIYRAVYQTGRDNTSASTAITKTEYAGVDLLVGGVQVVDVRAQRGEPATSAETRAAASSASAQNGGASFGGNTSGKQDQQVVPVQIVTVAVPPDVAKQIIQLVAETHGPVELWLSLAPARGESGAVADAGQK